MPYLTPYVFQKKGIRYKKRQNFVGFAFFKSGKPFFAIFFN